jgi:hypothetical protein
MNTKELIEQIKCLKNIFGNKTKYVEKDMVIKIISELDKPQKVKVSEEEEKFLKTFDFNCESDVAKALYCVSRTGWGYLLKDNNDIEFEGLSEGFRELENRKRLIKAILDGYEVEKEPKYIVKVKGLGHEFRILKYNIFYNDWFTGSERGDSSFRLHHTRKELEKAGFGWVFDCPGIEIEEIIE